MGLVVVSAIFPVLSAVALYFRMVAVRQNTNRQSGWDEIWLIISWITTLPLSIVVWVVAARSGIDYYKIDEVTGVKYSLMVSSHLTPPCLVTMAPPNHCL